jgi:hypothetical protein
MNRSMRSFLSLTSAAALAGVLGGCGDSVTGPKGGPSPTPPVACTQAVVYQDQGQIPAKIVAELAFNTTVTARLDVIVGWTHADSPIGVYVVPANSCDIRAFNARTCNFLIQSESGAQPRKVSAASVAPGSYDLLIANFATRDESVSTQVISSTSTCPAIAAESVPSAEANPGAVQGLVRR